MADVYSKYLQKDISFPELEDTTPHDILDGIITESGITASYKPWYINGKHSVVHCTMTDSNGRTAEGLGETTDTTLTTSAQSNYPVMMAVKRAFDNAALTILGINKQDFKMLVFNDEEPADKMKPAGQPAAAAKQNTHYEDVVITIGRKGKSGYTVKQLAENDMESLVYIATQYAEKYTTRDPKKIQMVEACRKWLSDHSEYEAA